MPHHREETCLPWQNVLKFYLSLKGGTSAMQHYVATRSMFIDVEVINADTRLVLGDEGSQANPNNVSRELSITETVCKEAATIMVVFPSPNEVMSILVQQVLEQRITALLDKLLVDITSLGEGNSLPLTSNSPYLDVEGLTESLFSAHKDGYPAHEQASFKQLYQAKNCVLKASRCLNQVEQSGAQKGQQ